MAPAIAQVARTFRFIWRHPANRHRRLRAVGTAIGWQLYKRATGRSVDLKIADSLRLRCYPDSTSASLVLYCAGRPDYHEMAFMSRYLRPGDGFIDVGANVGVYTLYAAAFVGRQAVIDSFEPAPNSAHRLRENLALNGLCNVTVHEMAVGSANDDVRLSVDKDDTCNQIRTDAVVASGRMVEVPCVRLDDWVQHRCYAMGKMDIEGAEPLALIGGELMLQRANPPVWLLEMNGRLHEYGFTEEWLKGWLSDRGYDVALYDADTETLSRPDRPWETGGNVLAIARRQWEAVVDRINAGTVRGYQKTSCARNPAVVET